MTRNLVVGDVLESVLRDGVVLLVYTGRHAVMGDAVRVIGKVLGARPARFEGLAALPGYIIFYDPKHHWYGRQWARDAVAHHRRRNLEDAPDEAHR